MGTPAQIAQMLYGPMQSFASSSPSAAPAPGDRAGASPGAQMQAAQQSSGGTVLEDYVQATQAAAARGATLGVSNA